MAKSLPSDRADYEDRPLTRTEYIAAIVHLYRGELYRATVWRTRLDNTTNWAVLTTAGLLTFSFGSEENSPWVLLFGHFLITILLFYEARRFRFFDVWRARVRKIEENFYGPILRRDPVSPERDWGDRVAEDLLAPSFKITLMSAVRARFTRNYWVLHAVLLGAWVLKVAIHSPIPHGWPEVRGYVAAGLVPWWCALLFIGGLLLAGTLLLTLAPRAPESEVEYWSAQVEPRGKDLPMLDT